MRSGGWKGSRLGGSGIMRRGLWKEGLEIFNGGCDGGVLLILWERIWIGMDNGFGVRLRRVLNCCVQGWIGLWR